MSGARGTFKVSRAFPYQKYGSFGRKVGELAGFGVRRWILGAGWPAWEKAHINH
jgi:hypothetical protein